MNNEANIEMKRNTHMGISFILSIFLWFYLWWVVGLWNILLSILFPLYFIVFNVIQLIFAGKSETSFYQVLYYVNNGVKNALEKNDIPIDQAVINVISGFKKVCFRLKNDDDFWKKLKQEAIYELSNSNEYYKILELDNNASLDDIKKAYKRLSKIYHPDMNINKTAKEKHIAEEKFKLINEAYRNLTLHHQK